MSKPRHGHSANNRNTRTYMVWVTMRQRCSNKKTPSYPRYGGRGITVCERWSVFENFLTDMGEAPEGLTLDRRDNDGPYCKENCAWAPQSEQARNKCSSRTFEIGGVLRNVCDIEAELGLSQGAIWHRLKSGWPVDRAITQGRSK